METIVIKIDENHEVRYAKKEIKDLDLSFLRGMALTKEDKQRMCDDFNKVEAERAKKEIEKINKQLDLDRMKQYKLDQQKYDELKKQAVEEFKGQEIAKQKAAMEANTKHLATKLKSDISSTQKDVEKSIEHAQLTHDAYGETIKENIRKHLYSSEQEIDDDVRYMQTLANQVKHVKKVSLIYKRFYTMVDNLSTTQDITRFISQLQEIAPAMINTDLGKKMQESVESLKNLQRQFNEFHENVGEALDVNNLNVAMDPTHAQLASEFKGFWKETLEATVNDISIPSQISPDVNRNKLREFSYSNKNNVINLSKKNNVIEMKANKNKSAEPQLRMSM